MFRTLLILLKAPIKQLGVSKVLQEYGVERRDALAQTVPPEKPDPCRKCDDVYFDCIDHVRVCPSMIKQCVDNMFSPTTAANIS